MAGLKIKISMKHLRAYIENSDSQSYDAHDIEKAKQEGAESREANSNVENKKCADRDIHGGDEDAIKEGTEEKTDDDAQFKMDEAVVLEREASNGDSKKTGDDNFRNSNSTCDETESESDEPCSKGNVRLASSEKSRMGSEERKNSGEVTCADLLEVVLQEGEPEMEVETTNHALDHRLQQEKWTYNEEDFIKEFGDGLIVDVDVDVIKEEEENKLLDSLCAVDVNNLDCLTTEDVLLKKNEEKQEEKRVEDTKETEAPVVKKVFKSKLPRRNLLKHKVVYYDEKYDSYVCQHCGYKAKQKKPVIMHVTMKHNRKGVQFKVIMPKHKRKPRQLKAKPEAKTNGVIWFECLHCTFTSKSRLTYKAHMRTEHDADAQLHICPVCDFQARRKDNLMRHMRVRHEDGTELFQCQQCDFQAWNKFKLKDHMKDVHVKQKPKREFRCNECEFITEGRKQLSLHVKGEHNKEIHQCDQCEYKTRFRHYLKKHIRSTHNETLCYQCTVCEYTTKRMDSLKRHFIVRHEELTNAEVLQCPQCDYRTKLRGYLSKHIKTVHNKQPLVLRCSTCDFQTSVRVEMTRHREQVHGEVSKCHQCQFCEYRTDKRNRLQMHVRARHGEEPGEVFRCVLCDYDARFLDHITKHMKKKHAWY